MLYKVIFPYIEPYVKQDDVLLFVALAFMTFMYFQYSDYHTVHQAYVEQHDNLEQEYDKLLGRVQELTRLTTSLQNSRSALQGVNNRCKDTIQELKEDKKKLMHVLEDLVVHWDRQMSYSEVKEYCRMLEKEGHVIAYPTNFSFPKKNPRSAKRYYESDSESDNQVSRKRYIKRELEYDDNDSDSDYVPDE
jgi:DNA repair exonuclease SbcCD ATPase subunit